MNGLFTTFDLEIMPVDFHFAKWEFIFQLLATFILLWFLYKKLYPNFREYLDKRKDFINETIDKTKSDAQVAEKLKAEKQQELDELKSSHKEIVEKYTTEAKSMSNEIVNDAKTKATFLLEKNAQEIESSKLEARDELSEEVLVAATQVAEKFLKQKLTSQDDLDLINEALEKVTNE